jgi:hypothetical protein
MESCPIIRLFLRSKIFLIYNTIVFIPQEHYILVLVWIFSQRILGSYFFHFPLICFSISMLIGIKYKREHVYNQLHV